MLQLVIPATELWNSKTQEFTSIEETALTMEHSLMSISKWESKWKKPFLSSESKTNEEALDYYRCMVVSPKNIDPSIFCYLTRANKLKIEEYISSSQTATTLPSSKKKEGVGRIKKEIITSELVYYWMITFGIPFECEKWPFSRLMTLIEICSIKNAKPKKRSKNDILRDNMALNAARKKALNTKG